MKKTFLLLLYLLTRLSISAQIAGENTLVFRRLTQTEGLASNKVTSILQDHNGFMWFGTNKGLNRYDGHSFLTFNYNPADTNSLGSDRISDLFEDKRGRLWIGTKDNGFAIYDQVSQKFKRYQHSEKDTNSINKGSIECIYEDREGHYWICLFGGGLELFDEPANRFIHHKWNIDDTDGLASNQVEAIYETSPGKYLVGTFEKGNGEGKKCKQKWGHINQYDFNTNHFQPLKVTGVTLKPSYGQPLNYLETLVQAIMPDSAGNIWFATYVGIIKYNPKKNIFNYYESDPSNPSSLSLNRVNAVCELNGHILFGTNGGGISILDTNNEKFTCYKNDPLNLNSISDDEINVLYKDHKNRIWIGTGGGGVNILEPPNTDFVLFSNGILRQNENSRAEKIRTICKGPNEDLLIGTSGGLFLLNTQSGKFKFIEVSYNQNGILLPGPVYAITPSGNGKYWVGGIGFIASFDPRSPRLEHKYFRDNPHPTDVAVHSIIKLQDGHSLLASFWSQGSSAFEPGTGSFKLHDPETYIYFNTLDSQKNFWGFSDRSGVMKFDSFWHKTLFKHDINDTNSLSSNVVDYIFCDKKGRIWIPTAKGLDRYDDQTGHFIHYRNINNFPDSIINAMNEDKRGNLWFLTNEALIKFNPDTKQATSYLVSIDLPVHKLENQIIYDEVNDAMYFIASEGIVCFHPGKLKEEHSIPPLFITDIKLFNKIAYFDSSAILKSFYKLSSDQNFITIDFTALNYSHPGSNQYAYKMDGLNKEWNYIGNEHEANFTNLNPGTYIFRLIGSSRKGIWDQECKPLTIFIAPPWWQNWWFYVFCCLFVVTVLVWYNKFRSAIFRKQKLKLEETVEKRTEQYKEQKERAEESERFRLQFLANMSHEIRTPMNAVSGMTDLLMEKNPRPDQVNYLQAISKSSDNLLRIIDDILNLSKIETGKLELENIDFSLSETVRLVKETLSYKAEEKGLELIIQISEDIPDVLSGDPFRLNQVLMNLVGNALKFTEKGGVQIEVTRLQKDTGKITLNFSVTDTGIGIPKDKLPILFESFRQVHNSDTRRYAGSGLGLSISKQLVELQGGTMSVESSEGTGSTFRFVIAYPQGSEQQLKQRTVREQKVNAHILDGLRILLAEDNEYNRLLVNESLRLKANVLIDVAVNGEEAVEMVRKNNYDLVLMDVQMPVMSGLDATRYIREHIPEPKNKIPVIAFTASILRSDIDMCLQAGMNAYIPKPFKAWQLVNIMADVAGIQRGIDMAPASVADEIISSELNIETVTNLTYLKDYCEGEKDRMKMYVTLYLKAVPGLKEKLNEAVAKGNFKEIAHQMHSFKPKWVMMGMVSTLETGNKIYLLCTENNSEAFLLVSSIILDSDKSVVELADKY